MWPAHDPDLIRSFASRLAARLGRDGEVRCESWREGASNAVWRLDVGDLRAVLKVGKLADWRRLELEASVLHAIGGRGTPTVFANGHAGDALPWDWSVLERVEGIHPDRLTHASAHELGRTLAGLRKVEFGSLLPSRAWWRFVEDRIRHPLSKAGSAPPDLLDRFSRLIEQVERDPALGGLLDSLPPGVVHGDLIPLNLVEKPDGTFSVLDWENPGIGSACWDLAGVRKAFKLDPGAWEALVRALGEPVPEQAIDFADALQQLQVAAWRTETWWGHENRSAGAYFLEELGQELEKAGSLLSRL
jgi:aminoglycoside phosphotransferase (APT) family kinase protein